MSVQIQPAVMTIQQFTHWACVSRAKVYLLMNDGALPSFKLGARRLIRVADAEAWLAGLQSPVSRTHPL